MVIQKSYFCWKSVFLSANMNVFSKELLFCVSNIVLYVHISLLTVLPMTISFIDTWPRHWNYHVSHACSLYRVDHSADHQHIQLDHDSLTVTDLNMKDLTMTDLTMTAWPWQQDHDSTNKLGHLKKWKTKKHNFVTVIERH